MMELNYLNLGNYEMGTLTLPAGEEEIMNFFGELNPNDNDIELQWVESDYNVDGVLNDLHLDDLVELSEMEEYDRENVIKIMLADRSYEEACEIVRNGEFLIYTDCFDMGQVAEQWYEETGQMSEIPDHLQNYIDWDKVGRDMDIEGDFTYLGQGEYIQIW